MPSLEELLEDTGLFESVASTEEEDTEQCVGRSLDPRLWVELIKLLLIVEQKAVEKGDIQDTAIEVLKIYYMSEGGKLQFLWKISCYKMGWLSRAFPKIPKADWAKGFHIDIDLNRKENTIPLVSSSPDTRYPNMRDIGHLGITDMSGNE